MFIQLCYGIWMVWFAGQKQTVHDVENKNSDIGVSIVICAHNEYEQLLQNLSYFVEQEYPNFELIVVNDRSTDDTAVFLKNIEDSFPHVQVVEVDVEAPRRFPGKKDALQYGVSAANYPYLLFSDADCRPASRYWLARMVQAFTLNHNTQVVAGYGAYRAQKGWIACFTQWEALHSFVLYSTFANSKMPYMAVGRNLATTKEAFLHAQDDARWAITPSGDDDLLVNITAQKYKHSVMINAEIDAFTYTDPKVHFKDWLAQKQRHVSTGKLYNNPAKILLGLYGLSHGLLWLLYIILLLTGYGYLCNSMMLLRCLLFWGVWSQHAQQMKQSKLIIYLPLMDIGWAVYNLAVSPYIFFKNKQKWT